ncbi:MAG: hypothetical protein JWN45_2810 [Acidobacteriaceae bacterium]|nr:hypothetical protein [Acidobacteriaceae bacterium]
MQKTLRFVAVVLFAVATAAVARTPISKNVVLHEGSSPMPSCYPGQICQ